MILLIPFFNYGQETNKLVSNQSKNKNFSKQLEHLDYKSWKKIKDSKFNKINDSLFKISPVDYLRFLITTEFSGENNLVTNRNRLFALSIPFENSINNSWIEEKDIEILIKYVKSKEFAYLPYSTISSAASTDNSTIGIEAMHLINIYKNKKFYYPDLCSTIYFCKLENQDKLAEEYIIWWKNLKD